MPESDFERRLATLLRRTAADIPPELDVSARVHQQVLSGGQHGAHGGRRWIAVASMVAVVTLLIGTFTWFHGTGPRTSPTPSPTVLPMPTSTPTLAPSPFALQVDAAYADATVTAITFHITGPSGGNVYYSTELSLTDAAGDYSVHNLTESTGQPNGSWALFPPMPEPELWVPQTLTLTTNEVDSLPLTFTGTTSPAVTIVSGLWRVPVAITPVAGTSTPLQAAAQTQHNLSIQSLRVDVAPDAPLVGGLYKPGGVGIVIRMSGLAPGASFPLLATAYKNIRGGGGPNAGSQPLLSAAGAPACCQTSS